MPYRLYRHPEFAGLYNVVGIKLTDFTWRVSHFYIDIMSGRLLCLLSIVCIMLTAVYVKCHAFGLIPVRILTYDKHNEIVYVLSVQKLTSYTRQVHKRSNVSLYNTQSKHRGIRFTFHNLYSSSF